MIYNIKSARNNFISYTTLLTRLFQRIKENNYFDVIVTTSIIV